MTSGTFPRSFVVIQVLQKGKLTILSPNDHSDQLWLYHGNLFISTFPPHSITPTFFILSSILRNLSDMAAATAAPDAASITS